MESSAEPAAMSAGEPDAVSSGLPAMPTPASSVGPTRILLVEDEENFRDPLAFGLRRDGFEVVEAEDGQRAVDIFESSRRPGGVGPIDLVLLDLMLPRLDGTEVCTRIRRTSSVPVIMLSAKDTELDKIVGLEIGADDYVTKPYSYRELLARLKAVLRRSRVVPDGCGWTWSGTTSGSMASLSTCRCGSSSSWSSSSDIPAGFSLAARSSSVSGGPITREIRKPWTFMSNGSGEGLRWMPPNRFSSPPSEVLAIASTVARSADPLSGANAFPNRLRCDRCEIRPRSFRGMT